MIKKIFFNLIDLTVPQSKFTFAQNTVHYHFSSQWFIDKAFNPKKYLVHDLYQLLIHIGSATHQPLWIYLLYIFMITNIRNLKGSRNAVSSLEQHNHWAENIINKYYL